MQLLVSTNTKRSIGHLHNPSNRINVGSLLHNPSNKINVSKKSCQSAFSDRPGLAEVDSVQDFLVKGGSGQFICYLEDLGFPEAEHFAWKLLVPRKSLPMPLLFLDPSMILIQHKYGITLFLKDL